MAVRMETIMDLLEQREWRACGDLAARALTEGSWDMKQRASLLYAQCRSLSNQDRFSEALNPGRRAIYLAEEAQDYDLLGEALIELTFIQGRLPGMEAQAVESQTRYLSLVDKYGEKTRRHYLPSMFNLGVLHRTAGDQRQALAQFLKAMDAAKARRDASMADRCRRNAALHALNLGETSIAKRLIEESKHYVSQHPGDVRASAIQLINEASLALRQGDPSEAAALGIEAVLVGAAFNDVVADAFELLHQIGKQTGEIEAALALAILAKNQAEQEGQLDVVARMRASVRELSLRFPEAVERFMRDLSKTV